MGPPLLLCPATGGSGASFWQQIPALARRHRVLVVDQPPGGVHGPRELETVLDLAGVGGVHAIGDGTGAAAVLALASRTRQRVRSLVLSGSLAGIAAPAVAAAVGGVGAMVSPAGASSRLRARYRSFQPELAVLYDCLHGSSCGALRPPPRIPSLALAGVTQPALFVAGEDDEMYRCGAVDAAAAVLPRSTVSAIPRCGPVPHFEAAEHWNALVLDHLAAVEQGPEEADDESMAEAR